MNEQDLYAKVAASEQQNKDHERRIGTVEHRLYKIEKEQKAIYELAASVKVIAERVGNIEEKVDDTNRKVNEQAKTLREVENRPYKRTHDNVNSIRLAIITGICSLLVSGAVSCIINLIGK